MVLPMFAVSAARRGAARPSSRAADFFAALTAKYLTFGRAGHTVPQGASNTIREQQKLFQAQKKATGNTHTARGMAVNIAAFLFISVGGTFQMLSALRKLYWGVGKIELKDD